MFTVAKLQAAVLVELRSCCLPTQMQHQTSSSPSKECHPKLFAAAGRAKITDWQEAIATHKGHIQDWMYFKTRTPYLVPWSDSPCLALCRDCGVQKSCTGIPPWAPAIIWLGWCCGAWVYTVKWQQLWYWGDKKWTWTVAWKINCYFKLTCSFTL